MVATLIVRHLRISCGVLFLVLATAPSAKGACADDGLDAYRLNGHRAAIVAFGHALETPECSKDTITLLNYARSIEAISDKEQNGPMACEGAELLMRIVRDRDAAFKISTMASAGVERLSQSCTALGISTHATYTALLRRAAHAQTATRLFHAQLSLDAAVRLAPERKSAHGKLCNLLKNSNKQSAQRHCDKLAALKARERAQTEGGHAAWIWSGLSIAFAGSGLVAYVLATRSANDAFDASTEARRASTAQDYSRYLAASQRQSRAIEDARQRQVTSWLLFGLGAASASVAGYYWLRDESVGVAVGPRQIGFSVKF